MASIAQTILDHTSNKQNPHNRTKADLNLGHLKNYPLPTVAEARSGSLPGRYMTPRRLRDMFDGILIRQGKMDQNGNLIL